MAGRVRGRRLGSKVDNRAIGPFVIPDIGVPSHASGPQCQEFGGLDGLRGSRSAAGEGRKVLAGQGGSRGDEVRGGSLEDDPATVVTGAWAEVDDPVRIAMTAWWRSMTNLTKFLELPAASQERMARAISTPAAQRAITTGDVSALGPEFAVRSSDCHEDDHI